MLVRFFYKFIDNLVYKFKHFKMYYKNPLTWLNEKPFIYQLKEENADFLTAIFM